MNTATVAIQSFPVSHLPILDARSVKADYGHLLVLTEDGTFHGINLDTGKTAILCSTSLPELPGGDEGSYFGAPAFRLHASADGRFAAVVVDRGRTGIVVEIASGKLTMQLDGGDYHEHTVPFSAGFTHFQGRNALIHRTAWNRLDAADPATGESLTSRDIAVYEAGGARPDHYLDYFHGQLRLSPDGSRILDDGWVWHPVSVPRIWSVSDWLGSNPWESEDGPSIMDFPIREDWNIPACWIDDRHVALWGLSEWDEDEFEEVAKGPGAQILDAESKEKASPERWPMDLKGGKVRELFSDGQRLYIADESGTTAWDIASRSQVSAWPNFLTHIFDAERGMLFAIESTAISGLRLPWASGNEGRLVK
ncbi:hypothetical protein [Massilia sp. NR 4-1]|uniref:hypothetical protein n=1 Tax=Massilia sp. NR 4-1 TaxID=1678028 RepID=UPI00067A7559|nr:hypothetical protein [Massilia sp. NR 4-1]